MLVNGASNLIVDEDLYIVNLLVARTDRAWLTRSRWAVGAADFVVVGEPGGALVGAPFDVRSTADRLNPCRPGVK